MVKNLERSQPDPLPDNETDDDAKIDIIARQANPMKYVSLHSHSTFSYGDGFGPVKDHVTRVAELGMTALALTEHGNLSSHAQLEKAGNSLGIKPIFGCELYVAPPNEARKCHQTVVAMNQEGLRNLNRIVTASWKNFYRWPTVSWDLLKEYSDGLIVLSGCADSVLSCTLLGGKAYGEKRLEYSDADFKRARRVIEGYQKVFGERYFLEVQRFPGLQRTCVLNPAFAELSRITGAGLVASSDVHYPTPADNTMQTILHAAHRGSTVEATEASWEYDILLTYPLSDNEIHGQLIGTGLKPSEATSAIDNTAAIAEMCTVELPKNQPIRFPLNGTGFTRTEDLIRKWLNEGWFFRAAQNTNMLKNRRAYIERAELELGLMKEKDFLDYFLVLSDAVRWAKDNKIPVGPARGSAAASLVCYLLRITEVDPMLFPHMLFERFIDPTRTELPDVDLDFADDRRVEVKHYLERKYGKDHVGNIGNFTRYRGKNSIDDVARVYNIPAWECNTIKDLIIERSGGDSRVSDSLQDTFDMFPKAADVLTRFPQLQNAVRLEGNYRGMGVHAAGIVISNAPITDTCAVYTRTNGDGEEVSVIAYDKKDGEYVGMLKADFLGLSTMGMIGLAIDTIGMDLEDLYRIPLDDPKTLHAFRTGDLTGIFQFEGRATRIVCNDVKPDHFQHLADVNALSRPGPLFSGMTAAYVEVKHGRAKPQRLHPIVDELADWTYGQIVYQEQVLRTIREVGGFPMADVHAIRKIISQKLGEAQFEKLFAQFEEGAKRLHGIDSDLALKIWRFLSTSATYSFCVTGDTMLEKGASGRYDPRVEVSVAELYEAQQSKTPVGEKMRGSRGIKILGMDDDGRIRPNRLIKIHDPVPVECYQITTDTGRTVTVSKDHQILADTGYVHMRDLSVGMNLVVSLGKEGRQAELEEQNAARHPGQRYGAWAGMAGSGNPAWVDGRSVALKDAQNKVVARDGNCCAHCQKANDGKAHTLEFAHVMTLTDLGGDYSRYHHPDNMMQLCNSCHKKFDYRMQGTRNKRWTHGRPTGIERIVEIKRVGTQLVYDISMQGPSHNYQGNGFIHHNNIAHCISYSMLAFWQMWIKQHHPTAFYAAQLQKVNDEKRMKLMQDALRHQIAVLPPDLATSQATWSATDNGSVRAGFLQIPGIGPKTSEAVVSWRNQRLSTIRSMSTSGQTTKVHSGVAVTDLDAPTSSGVNKSAKSVARQRISSRSTDSSTDTCEWLTWDEMVEIRGIGPKTVDRIKGFVTSDDPFQLNRVADLFKLLRRQIVPGNPYGVPIPTHVSDTIPRNGTHDNIVWMGVPKFKNYQDFVENQRSRYGKDTEEIIREMKDPHLVKSCVVQCFDDYDDDVYCRWNRWQFPKFQEMLESLSMNGDNVLIVRGIKRDDFGVSIHVKDAWVLELSEEEAL